MRTIINMLAVGAVLLGGFSTARAAEPTPPATPPGGVSENTIKNILLDQGYDVTLKADPEGNKYLAVTFSKNDLEFNLLVEISPSRTKVWIVHWFTGMPTADKLTATDMMKLLAFNNTSVSAISVNEKTKKIYLKRPLDNRGLTRAVVVAEIEKFAADVVEFRSIWDELRGDDDANNR